MEGGGGERGEGIRCKHSVEVKRGASGMNTSMASARDSTIYRFSRANGISTVVSAVSICGKLE